MLIEQLKNKNAIEKAEIKSIELAKVKIGKFKKDNLDIEIIGDIKAIEINGSHGIEFLAKAWKNNKQLGFSKDGSVEIERFRIFNPPVLVDDENGDIIREWTDEITKEKKQRKLKYNSEEAIKQSLAHTIGLVGKEDTKIIKGKIGNTTSTFYPDANPESTSVDGMVGRDGVNEIFSTIRAGAGTYSNPTSDNRRIELDSHADTNQYSGLYVVIALFDTSAIDDGDAVSSATFSVYGAGVGEGIAGQSLVMTNSTPASNTNLVNADYGERGSTEQSSNRIAISSFNASGYNDFTLNATGISNVSITGISKFALQLSCDFDNSTPTWVSATYVYAEINTADHAGTANDPKLVVVHEAAVTAPTVTTQAVSSIEETTATGNGNITVTGGEDASAWGVCYKTTTGPTTSDSTAAGSGSGGVGAFTSSITGLTKNTKYYLKAYATNTAGTSYGAEVTFVTDNSGTWTGDSSLKKEIFATFTGNANLKSIESTTFLSDANLKKEIFTTFTSNASLKSVESTIFTGDANLKKEQSAIFTGNASLKSIESTTFTSNANLKEEQSTAFTGDANLKREYDFTGDANLKDEVSTNFTSDASIVARKLAYPWQRKNWFNSTDHWRASFDPSISAIKFEYSTDLLNWTENTSARINDAGISSDFSIRGDDSYVYIVYSNGEDILGRKAKAYPANNFTWNDSSIIYDGSDDNGNYTYPNISYDGNESRLNVLATLQLDADNNYTLYNKKATAANQVPSETTAKYALVASQADEVFGTIRRNTDNTLSSLVAVWKKGSTIQSAYRNGSDNINDWEADQSIATGKAGTSQAICVEHSQIDGSTVLIYIDSDGKAHAQHRAAGSSQSWNDNGVLHDNTNCRYPCVGERTVDHLQFLIWLDDNDHIRERIYNAETNVWSPILANAPTDKGTKVGSRWYNISSGAPAIFCCWEKIDYTIDCLKLEDDTEPTKPTSLEAENTTNPVGVADLTPELTGLFHDTDTDDKSRQYQIEVKADGANFISALQLTDLENMTSSGISFGGSGKIVIYGLGDANSEGGYLTSGGFTNGSAFSADRNLQIHFEDVSCSAGATLTLTFDTGQTKIIYLSEIISGDEWNLFPTDDGTSWYSSYFTSLAYANTNTQWLMSPADFTVQPGDGERCENISYAGNALSLDGSKYYWRIRMKDLAGAWSPWSDESASFTMTTSATFTGDANLTGEIATSFTGDANLKGVDISTTFTSDSTILHIVTGSFTSDANLKQETSTTFTSDVSLKSIISATFTGDSAMAAQISSSFTSDGNLKTELQATFISDANLKTELSDTFTSNANLERIVSNTFLSDAVLCKIVSSAFTADSNLSQNISGTYTGDSLLVTTVQNSITGDASLKAIESTTFTGNASLKSIESTTFTSDANLKVIESTSFTGDASLKGTAVLGFAGIITLNNDQQTYGYGLAAGMEFPCDFDEHVEFPLTLN